MPKRFQVHKKHLVQEEITPYTDSMLTCMSFHTTSTCMPADAYNIIVLCSLYMHTIPLPPVMLCNNPLSLRLAPLMPCIALHAYVRKFKVKYGSPLTSFLPDALPVISRFSQKANVDGCPPQCRLQETAACRHALASTGTPLSPPDCRN